MRTAGPPTICCCPSIRWTASRSRRRRSGPPCPRLQTGVRSACPSQLYVYDEATGENCRERFREKVAALSVETIPVGNSQTMEHTGAVQDDPRMPYSLASTEVLYEAEDGSDEVRWTLTMENGDVIVLRHYLSIPEDLYPQLPGGGRTHGDCGGASGPAGPHRCHSG